MMNFTVKTVSAPVTTTAPVAPAPSYATTKNSRFKNSASNLLTISDRWNSTLKNLPLHQQKLVAYTLSQTKAEFRRRNPSLKKWKDLNLAQANDLIMTSIFIDETMQRELNIHWVLEIVNNFIETMVEPIKVYQPVENKYVAWDCQHTLMALWIIASIMGEDPDKISVPATIYSTSKKAEMRNNFISHNGGEGKKPLAAIDIWDQMVHGVRTDGSQKDKWVLAERKQTAIEQFDLFVTASKFGDDTQPGAISRLHEINKLTVESVEHLAEYLFYSTKLQRPAVEKEIVMMSHFFDRCRHEGITITSTYITDLAWAIEQLWNSDFSREGKFWHYARISYCNWHDFYFKGLTTARFKKEPVHGFPYMIEQLKKSFNHPLPKSDSNSEFRPLKKDLI